MTCGVLARLAAYICRSVSAVGCHMWKSLGCGSSTKYKYSQQNAEHAIDFENPAFRTLLRADAGA